MVHTADRPSSTSAWLVTGGAGYIGAHVVRALADSGRTPIVLDNLSSGHASFVPEGVPFVRASVLDRRAVVSTLNDYSIDGVVHVAGFKYAGVSMKQPLHTYAENVRGTLTLLEAMAETSVARIVFSSSAAVYGSPRTELVTEDTVKSPESPYGESKLIGEWLLSDQALATRDSDRPLRHTSLRYFNVVGAGAPSVYDSSPHNLFPLVFEALLNGRVPRIFGDDYTTPDGTTVRDYVHVDDVARAHARAADRLMREDAVEPAYNLGSGSGLSVRQIMDAVAEVTGIPFTPEISPRRAGDPGRIVASGELATRDLDWRMRHSVEDMVRSAWNARTSAPR